jgi:type II secretion system protein H
MRRPVPAARAGFTLVELVVVMFIIAVATAVVVPALLPPPDVDDVTHALSRVDELFRTARDSAVRGGEPLLVSIDSATGLIWVVPERMRADVADAAPAAGALRPPGMLRRGEADVPGISLGLRPSVRLELSSARARFLFSPSGASFGDTLALRSGAHVRAVRLDPWTGHAILH